MPECKHCKVVKMLKCRGLCSRCHRKYGKFYPRLLNPKGPRCRHCGTRKACRPRGLCFGCSLDPAIRAQHPCESKFAQWANGALDFDGPAETPAEPTRCEPGSEEKIAVLAARAAQGVSLHHDDDVKCGKATEWELHEFKAPKVALGLAV